MENLFKNFEDLSKKSSKLFDSVKESTKEVSNNAIDLVNQKVTQPISDSLAARREGAGKLIETATTNEGIRNPNIHSLKGFLFEQEHARTFNENAIRQSSDYRAVVIPAGQAGGGKGEPDIIIVHKDDVKYCNSLEDIKEHNVEILKTIQAKVGSDSYIHKSINDEKYNDGNTDEILINADSKYANNLENTQITTQIEFDNIQSQKITLDDIEKIAEQLSEEDDEYPEELENTANIEEVESGMLIGASLGGIFQTLQHSIKILAKVYKGEEVSKELFINALKDVMQTALNSSIRGALIKVIKIILDKQMEDSDSLPLVIVSITPIVYETILKYLQKELTFEECVKQVGEKTLSKAMIVTIGVIFPPLGVTLMGLSISKTIWKEFDMEKVLKNSYPESKKIFEIIESVEYQKNIFVDNSKEHLETIKNKSNKIVDITKSKTIQTTDNISQNILDAYYETQEFFTTKKFQKLTPLPIYIKKYKSLIANKYEERNI